jgi:N-methylhydantoinase A/oxoprolinase/acetone carboxylase beta subunit
MDYAHRRHKSVSAMIPFGADVATKMRAAQVVDTAWEDLEHELLAELQQEGFGRDQISLRQIVYIRYYGQLNYVEVESPVSNLATEPDVDKLLARFEEIFTKMFTLAGKPTDPTYHFTEVSVIAQVDTVKPKLVEHELEGRTPRKQASKGTREVFQKGQWHDAQLFEMSELRPGNEIDGLAVIEAPNTTLFLPAAWQMRIDEYDIYWLERKGGNR